MGYNKIISYGDTLELYEYEKDIFTYRRTIIQDRKDEFSVSDLGINGEDNLSERKLGKRQDNANRARLAFKRIVSANLGRSTSPLLVTLTYRDNITDLKKSYRHLSSFIQSLRHKYGKEFRYVCVPEFQRRGAVHFHALFWGLPKEIFLLERKNREIARLWSWGFVFLKETDGSDKLSFYLSKYMAKAFIDPRLKNQKCYVSSRNILRPRIITGVPSSGLEIVFNDLGIYENDKPLVDRTYSTSWLGEGRYRLFKRKL